ncbi:MAG: hypothetical protein AAF790_08060 [Planctomycetota bacterium]
MSGQSPADHSTLPSDPPRDEAGPGHGWVVIQFFLHAAAGVFSGRVLLLAAAALAVAELGAGGLGPSDASTRGAIALRPAAGAFAATGYRPIDAALAGQTRFWAAFVAPFALAARADGGAGWLVLVGLWRLAAWSLFGVAIARVAARHLTDNARPTAAESLRSSLQGWPRQIGGPAVLLVLVAAVAGVLWLLGYAARVGAIEAATVLLFPVVIAIAAVGVVLAAGLAIGGPMMLVSHAVERPDGFDAVSVGFAYTLQRPIRLLAYWAQALVVGVVVGALLAAAMDWLDAALGAWHAGRGELAPDAAGKPADSPVAVWTYLLAWAPMVFHAAYFWFAATGVFLLMRRDIDEKQADEIYTEPTSSASSASPAAGEA